MTAGLFRPGYEHWREVLTPDGSGGYEATWSKIADLTGRAYPTRLHDEVIAHRLAGVVIWTFASTLAANVIEGDEIRFGGRTLRVLAASVTGSGRRLECLCEERR